MQLNKTITTLFFIFLFTANMGCSEKAIEQKKEDLLVQLITTNIWVMSSFFENTTDLSAQFNGYEFKFNTDGTVFGIKAGQANAVGTWVGSTAAMTIVSNFPNETSVLKKLNGTFNITSTTLSSVKATRTEGSNEFKLYLVKK
jgi:hypothetical protein